MEGTLDIVCIYIFYLYVHLSHSFNILGVKMGSIHYHHPKTKHLLPPVFLCKTKASVMDWTSPSPKWSSRCLWMAEVSEAGLMMLMAIKKQKRHSKNRGILRLKAKCQANWCNGFNGSWFLHWFNWSDSFFVNPFGFGFGWNLSWIRSLKMSSRGDHQHPAIPPPSRDPNKTHLG